MIPDSVTSIGSSAFSGCAGLTSVTIGDGVTSIGSYAFSGCTGLTSIVIPDSVTSIDYYAFRNCTGLTSVVIPDSVTSIGSAAFYGCSSLESITLPFVGGSKTATSASASTLFGYIFGTSSYEGGVSTEQYYSSSKYTTYYIPESLRMVTVTGRNILYGAFYNCTSLTSIVIPDGVTSIDSHAFSNCTGLTIYCEAASKPSGWSSYWNNGSRPVVWGISEYGTTEEGLVWISKNNAVTIAGYVCDTSELVLPSLINGIPVTSIGSRAFYNCSGLTSIAIPDSVTSVGGSAFYGCTGLTSIEIPDSITSIGSSAFCGCTGLISVVIPDSVTSIGIYAFSGCTWLTIYCEAASKPSGWDSSWKPSSRPVVWGYTGEEYTYTFVVEGIDAIEPIVSNLPIALPTPVRDGWYFGGWYDNAEFTGTPVSAPYYSTTSHTLCAKWLTEEEWLATLDGSSFARAYIITVGNSLPAVVDTAGEYVYFKFTATESKTYTFTSSGSVDTYGYLYNVGGSQLAFDDDGNGDGDFRMTYSLSAGQVVYIGARLYSSSSTGTFTVNVQ